MYPWNELDIKDNIENIDKKTIRRAYAARSKECHPEINPEGFEQLQKAYRRALELIEERDQNTECEEYEGIEEHEVPIELANNITAETESERSDDASLIKKMESIQKKEIAEKIKTGILKKIHDLLQDSTNRNKANAWSELFSSDVFLGEFLTKEFMESFGRYLEQLPVMTEVADVPQAFLTELVLAYGMDTPIEYHMLGEDDIFIRHQIANFWNNQPEQWKMQRGNRIVAKDENETKRRDYQSFIELYLLYKKNLLTQEHWGAWIEPIRILSLSRYKQNKFELKNGLAIRLMTFFVEHYELPQCVVRELYKEVDGGHNRIPKYAPFIQLIEDKYFNDAYREAEQRTEKIRTWIGKVQNIGTGFVNHQCDNEVFDEKHAEETAEELFQDEVWLTFRDTDEFINKYLDMFCSDRMPLQIAKRIYEYYKDKDEERNNIQMVLQKTIRCLYLSESEILENPKPQFIQYIMAYGFGMKYFYQTAKRVYDDTTYEEKICLPQYLSRIYLLDREQDYLDNETVVTFHDGNELRSVFRGKWFDKYWNGVLTRKAVIDVDTFLVYEKELHSLEEFLAVLSFTFIDEERQPEVREVIISRYDDLKEKIIICKNIYETFADFVVSSNDEFNRFEDYEFSYHQELPLVFGKTSAYEQDTSTSYLPYSLTKEGLKQLPEIIARNDKIDTVEKAKKYYDHPLIQPVRELEFEGLSMEARAKAIIEGLELNAQLALKDYVKLPYIPNEKDYLFGLAMSGVEHVENVDLKEYAFVDRFFRENPVYCVNSFVLMEKYKDTRFNRPVGISLFGYGIEDGQEDGKWREDAKNIVSQIRKQKNIAGILIGKVVAGMTRYANPIVLGSDGKLYGRMHGTLSKVKEFHSLDELIMEYVYLMRYKGCQVFDTSIVPSRFDRDRWEYSFKLTDYLEGDNSSHYFGIFNGAGTV